MSKTEKIVEKLVEGIELLRKDKEKISKNKLFKWLESKEFKNDLQSILKQEKFTPTVFPNRSESMINFIKRRRQSLCKKYPDCSKTEIMLKLKEEWTGYVKNK